MIQDVYTGKLEVGNFSVITVRIYRYGSTFVWDMCHWDIFGGCQEVFRGSKKDLTDKVTEQYSDVISRMNSGSLTVLEISNYNKTLKILKEISKALELYPYEDDPVCDLWV